MIKRLLTIYLPAAAVLATATLAAVFLYNDADPELENVEFVEAEDPPRLARLDSAKRAELVEGEASAETENTDRIAVGAIHELPQQIDVSPNRDDIRSATNQIEPVIVTASGPGVSIRCEINLDDATTVHRVMQQAADQCNFGYDTKQYASLGVFVDGIADVSSNKTAGLYWIFSVNGTKANVGVSSYQIKPGDTITWNYEQEY